MAAVFHVSVVLFSPTASLAANCARVYIDAGTNNGVQLRKLFEPEHYPLASVLPLFDRYLGRARGQDASLCAFGFEPNVLHTKRLQEIESAYVSHGWKLRIFTETAVGPRNGTLSFLSTGSDYYDLAASSMPNDFLRKRRAPPLIRREVPMVDLAQFLLEEVGNRPLAAAKSAAVVMKLDIEGGEMELLPRLVHSGALCAVDVLYIEYHHWMFPREKGTENMTTRKEYSRTIRNYSSLSSVKGLLAETGASRNCRLKKMLPLDDETYRWDNGRPGAALERKVLKSNPGMEFRHVRPPLPTPGARMPNVSEDGGVLGLEGDMKKP